LLVYAHVVPPHLRVVVCDLATGQDRVAEIENKDLQQVKGAEDPFRTHIHSPVALVVARDGSTAVVARDASSILTMNTVVTVVDLRTMTRRHEREMSLVGTLGYGGKACLALSPDNSRLAAAVGGSNGASHVEVWNWSSGQPPKELPVADVAGLAFLADNQHLVIESRRLEVWDTAPTTGFPRLIRYLGTPQTGGTLLVGPGEQLLAWSALGKSGSGQRKPYVEAWNVAQEARFEQLTAASETDFSAPKFTPDGKTLIGSRALGLTFLDLATGKTSVTPLGEGSILGLDVASDGRHLAAWGQVPNKPMREPLLGFAYLWDMEERQTVLTIPGGCPDFLRYRCAFVEGGRYLDVLAGQDFQRWDVGARRQVAGWRCSDQDSCLVASSPNGHLVVTAPGPIEGWPQAQKKGFLKLWDARIGQEVAVLGEVGEVTGSTTQFSPNGRQVLTTSGHFSTTLFDVEARKPVATWPGSSSGGVFSPDGRIVALRFRDSVKLMDTTTGLERMTLPGPQVQAEALAFSSDGSTLAYTYGATALPLPLLFGKGETIFLYHTTGSSKTGPRPSER
jgi:WD40 repeat protein